MSRNSILKKFDKDLESFWDALYKMKDTLDSTEDYELSELAEKLIDQISESLEEGDVTTDIIREQILS
tara:strand:+ start:480 stop:683 length:204 start_codon:yes stop_codon:yes gene_type:complete